MTWRPKPSLGRDGVGCANGCRGCRGGREALEALVKLEQGAASSRGPCPGDSDPVGRRGELRRAGTSNLTATETEPVRSRTGWIPLWSWQMTPGECWKPPCGFAAGQIQLLGSDLWMIHSLCKGRVSGGEASQPGDYGPSGAARPCGPVQRSRSAPQVLPPFGGDADQELQRAGSLLLPAAHFPAAAAPAGHSPTHHPGPLHHYDTALGWDLCGGGFVPVPQDPLPYQDEDPLLEQLSPYGCVSGQLLWPVVPALHDGGGDGYHGVLRCLLLPADDGDGGGLWGEGSTAQHPEGRVHGGQHWALLLLLPLPAPNHHEQISAESVALWINTLVGVSTLFGLWALGILFRQARLHLAEQNMQGKFTCFQILLLLTALQPAIFSILANGGTIACSPPFSSKARSQQMNVQLLIPQTFILAVLTRMYYRKQDDKPGYQPVSCAPAGVKA
ncbi:organic solute transporter subunit alpha isoform X2 [Prinia subflava]|uniref:organic solute transporter subunit alpha isoform X2 n=1 Tax=Prinia subflava TaxID=208062 RepID=UPI002FE0DFBE